MKRNEFLQKLGLSSAAILGTYCLGALAARIREAPPPEAGSPDFTLDLTDPAYAPLRTNGGFVYQRDVIIARTTNGEFIALARQRTHEGYPVNFEPGTNAFSCPLHGSRFRADGSITGGPATVGLRRFNTEHRGNALRVYA